MKNYKLLDFIDLILIGFISLIGFLIVNSNEGALLSVIRLFVTLPVLVFFPGYIITNILFGSIKELSLLARMNLWIAFSFALIVFLCLGLILFSIPVNKSTIIFGHTLSVLILLLVDGLGRQRNNYDFINIFSFWNQKTKIEKAYISISGVFALLLLLILITKIENQNRGEYYTEFYILNPSTGKSDLPLIISENQGYYPLLLTITNHELTAQKYSIRISGNNESETINVPIVEKRENWSQLLNLYISWRNNIELIKIQLYRDAEKEPYRELHLWLKRVP